ncbi:hypothetical protein BB560_001330 [Smittium megazygosporum]|uniref:HTH La-type RNA-binding domain-containing protein n=1 Tax=Smittium megazygosporum TaxID=133381 RepID=A0A2T9ZHY0_9FUNG|nr:hypothetical protein BB560_001330 [Smittium megazygosporum]
MSHIKQGIEQLEYYLSDWNLRKDHNLRKALNESKDGWLSLEIFIEFSRFSKVCSELDFGPLLKEISKSSEILDANTKKRSIRRKKKFLDLDRDTIDKRTVYVEGLLPPLDTATLIKKHFSTFSDKISFVNPYYDLDSGKFYGFAFIEFADEDSTKDFVDIFKREDLDYDSEGESPLHSKIVNNERIINSLKHIKSICQGLRVLPKIEWEKLKSEYIEYKEKSQREYLRTCGIKDGSIIKVHGISANIRIETILDNISEIVKPVYIEYCPGSISAHIIFDNFSDALAATELIKSQELLNKVFTQDKDKNTSLVDDPNKGNADVESHTLPLRAKVLKGKEETNYWEHVASNKDDFYHFCSFDKIVRFSQGKN